MKGTVKLIRHKCELMEIRDGECFMINENGHVHMKCEPVSDDSVTTVNLITGKIQQRNRHETVILVYCEFAARSLTMEEAESL